MSACLDVVFVVDIMTDTRSHTFYLHHKQFIQSGEVKWIYSALNLLLLKFTSPKKIRFTFYWPIPDFNVNGFYHVIKKRMGSPCNSDSFPRILNKKL